MLRIVGLSGDRSVLGVGGARLKEVTQGAMDPSPWYQRELWHYWKGDKVVELRRSLIEYRPTETHQRFVVPYRRTDQHSILVLESDLREWDWIAEESKAVGGAERSRILEEMRQAVLVGGTILEVVNRRPDQTVITPLSSVESVSDYLFFLANLLRDGGADQLADRAFYAAMSFLPRNPITSEFLTHASAALEDVEAHPEQTTSEELLRIREVIARIKRALTR